MFITSKSLRALSLVVFAAVVAPSSARALATTTPGGGSPVVLDDAHRLVEQGQFAAAERTFRAVAVELRAVGKSPVAALRGLANVAYFRGNNRGAALALDELAAAASEYGDPEAQVNAVLDAALLYQELRDRPAVAARVVSLRRLLQSPALSASTRESINSRLIAD
jgi:hypothetical protein